MRKDNHEKVPIRTFEMSGSMRYRSRKDLQKSSSMIGTTAANPKQRGGALGDTQVSDIMLRNPVIATPDMEVNDLRRTMLETNARTLFP